VLGSVGASCKRAAGSQGLPWIGRPGTARGRAGRRVGGDYRLEAAIPSGLGPGLDAEARPRGDALQGRSRHTAIYSAVPYRGPPARPCHGTPQRSAPWHSRSNARSLAERSRLPGYWADGPRPGRPGRQPLDQVKEVPR